MSKKIDGKKLLEDTKKHVKAKKEKEEMNTIKKINWNTILTVFTTLFVVALLALYTWFVWNMATDHANNQNAAISAQVEHAVQLKEQAVEQ